MKNTCINCGNSLETELIYSELSKDFTCLKCEKEWFKTKTGLYPQDWLEEWKDGRFNKYSGEICALEFRAKFLGAK